MMKTEKTLVNVNKGQDAYSVIGNYISNHITAIEDMIAVIRINGCLTNQLYMVDVEAVGYFYWEKDWWEGEEDIALIDFFPVSEAERPQEWIPCNELFPDGITQVFIQTNAEAKHEAIYMGKDDYGHHVWETPDGEIYWDEEVVAWMLFPESYKEESEK